MQKRDAHAELLFFQSKPRENGRNIVGQQLPTFLHAKILTGFRLCPTAPKNMQQSVEKDATFNIQECWELLANDIASICAGLKPIAFLSFLANVAVIVA